MINKFSINKLLFILGIVFLYTFIFCSNVFAYDTTLSDNTVIQYPDKIVEYLQNTDYWNSNYTCVGVRHNYNGTYYFVFFFEKTDGLIVKLGLDYKNRLYFCSNKTTNIYTYKFNSDYSLNSIGSMYSKFDDDAEWSWFGSALSTNTYLCANGLVYIVNDKVSADYKNFDFSDEQLVFPEPPPTVEEQVTITGITQLAEIPQTMNKVLQLIIPIGLKILLMGLIIFLVRWVILQII